ncbi:MAG: flagellar hook basal-body protein [Syntrophobacterales bacterium]|nr:flagellar hook basal-body protein [Syntrophobacterales bacterium]
MSYAVTDIAAAASVKVDQLDIISNNIANVMTAGYKTEHLRASVGDNLPDPTVDRIPRITSSVYVDFSQGILQRTGNPLDAALQGEGFFEIETASGPAYTRAGNFSINQEGRLVNKSGQTVMGAAGPVIIAGNDVRITQSGNIQVDGVTVDTLRVVVFENKNALKRGEDGFFFDSGEAGLGEPESINIQAGFLELSNASAAKEMIQMINVQRAFELYQKAIWTVSDQDKLSVSRVGRLS